MRGPVCQGDIYSMCVRVQCFPYHYIGVGSPTIMMLLLLFISFIKSEQDGFTATLPGQCQHWLVINCLLCVDIQLTCSKSGPGPNCVSVMWPNTSFSIMLMIKDGCLCKRVFFFCSCKIWTNGFWPMFNYFIISWPLSCRLGSLVCHIGCIWGISWLTLDILYLTFIGFWIDLHGSCLHGTFLLWIWAITVSVLACF